MNEGSYAMTVIMDTMFAVRVAMNVLPFTAVRTQSHPHYVSKLQIDMAKQANLSNFTVLLHQGAHEK